MANKQGNLPFSDSAQLNMATYYDYYNRLKSLAVTMFKWKGLPNKISDRFLEDTLFHEGKAVFIKDSLKGEMITKVTIGGQLNTYNESTKYQAYSISYSKRYDADEIVLMRNNYLLRPTHETIELYARRLYEVERSIDTNIKGQKFPAVIKGTQAQMMTLQNIYLKYDGNQPVIMIDKNFDLEGAFKVFPTVSPYVADKLMLYKHDLWNEAMSFLGIANANTDKKERLITDEVQANDQLVQLAAQVMLATRQNAADEINAMFGLNVSVKQRGYEETGATIDPIMTGEGGSTNE